VTEKVVALLVLACIGPVKEIILLTLGFLRKQVVGQPDRKLALVGQLLDHGVVLRIILEPAARVDGGCKKNEMKEEK